MLLKWMSKAKAVTMLAPVCVVMTELGAWRWGDGNLYWLSGFRFGSPHTKHSNLEYFAAH